MHSQRILRLTGLLLAIVVLLTACAPAAPSQTVSPLPPTAVPATATSVPTAVPPTATARPTSVPATPTLVPTLAPIPVDLSGTNLPVLPEGTDGYPWWNDTTFYEIFVRSFADSDGNGIGDFKGLTAKLDYLNDGDPQTTTDLGINGIWLMPVNPSPSYHGYDVTDYQGINPDYGTLDDFKAFLKAAHQRGIRVILDFVLNHTSNQHPWFQAAQDPKSDKRSWYIWTEKSPGYVGPWKEQVWWPGPGGYYYAIFTAGMPDLNYRNPEVTQQMESTAQFWLKDIGVDGFRLDAAKHLIEDGQAQQNTEATHDWYKQFRTFYKKINPNAFTIGEVADTNENAAPYISGKDQLDMVFNFDLAEAIISNVFSLSGRRMGEQLSASVSLYPAGQFGSFLTNHDQNRAMSRLGSLDRARQAALIYLTGPGVPFIYYGEEIGMTGQKPDERLRSPMQWSSDANAGFTSGRSWEVINSDYDRVNVGAENQDPASLLTWYRDLVQLRDRHPALRVGDTFKVVPDKQAIYTTLRVSKTEAILVVANLGSTPLSDYKLDLDASSLKGKYQGKLLAGQGTIADLTVDDNGGYKAYKPLAELPAKGSFIILLQPVK